MKTLDGKIALITGGSKGLGAETARMLAENGAKVVLTARSEDKGQAVAESINAAGGTGCYFKHDVTSKNSWQEVLKKTMDTFHGLHILVNNAGVHQIKSVENTSLDDFQWMVDTNLKGVFLGAKTAIPVIHETTQDQESGCIINVSSTAGLIGAAFQALYNMTKGGVQLFTKSLALEMAALNYNIRANAVNPGIIENDMGNELINQLVKESIFPDSEFARAYMLNQYPLRKFATTSDVAKAILFLASDDSAYMTGTELVVDGGFTAM